MDKQNFLVTGIGRSGTKFLAYACNLSSSWQVEHEIKSAGEVKLVEAFTMGSVSVQEALTSVLPRFDRDRYGEVNSLLRFIEPFLPVARRAIILRDPKEIMISAANRRPVEMHHDISLRIYHYYLSVHARAEGIKRLKFFSFDWMTTDPVYLTDIFQFLGIDDLTANQEMLARVNETRNAAYSDLAQLSSEVQDVVKNTPYDRRLISRP